LTRLSEIGGPVDQEELRRALKRLGDLISFVHGRAWQSDSFNTGDVAIVVEFAQNVLIALDHSIRPDLRRAEEQIVVLKGLLDECQATLNDPTHPARWGWWRTAAEINTRRWEEAEESLGLMTRHRDALIREVERLQAEIRTLSKDRVI
jgi:uncharacterized NAD(P)/FAD-binding protein YdhS